MIESQFHILRNTLPLFESSINKFCDVLEKPIWSQDQNEGQPRYKNPHSGHFQLLMAVKIVSTLNAILCLLKEGHVQEVGALLRIIDECNAKICCMEEAHNKTLSSVHEEIINGYFKYDIRSANDILEQKKWWVSMREVFASQTRFLSEGTPNKDVHGIQQNIQGIYDVHTGYVHGFYPHIMELYDYNIKSFKLNGILDEPRHGEMMRAVSSAISRSFNTFAQISTRFGLSDLRNELIKSRDIFHESEAYKEGQSS